MPDNRIKAFLLGRHLAHSLSPLVHSYLGDYSYELKNLEPDELEGFMKKGEFDALNVTVPYKQAVTRYIDDFDITARVTGAVNTVVRRDGRLVGYNTDIYGFGKLLDLSGFDPKDKKTVVFGSGGASKAVCAVLKERNADFTVISRTGKNNYSNLSLYSDAALIVNTTPVGMYPDNGLCAAEPGCFRAPECVIDLIYNPLRTKLMLEAAEKNIPCFNGLYMLVAQAVSSVRIFLERKPETDILAVTRDISRRFENVALIGMPGSGKTTTGKILARLMQREFVDTDEYILNETGLTPAQIIESFGEEKFRELEHKALQKISAGHSLVISTGGGVVVNENNRHLLKQNSFVVFLERPLPELETASRPLSKNLGELYNARIEKYRQFGDTAVQAADTPEKTARRIYEAFNNKRTEY